MLIITRKPGERVMVGDDIVVHVMEPADLPEAAEFPARPSGTHI
jgi:hypothetical protein